MKIRTIILLACVAALPCMGSGSLQIESRDGKGGIAGEIHAIVEHPFAEVAPALRDPARWCEILMLHLDTKECHVAVEGARTLVSVAVVRRHDLPVSSAYRVTFIFQRVEDSASAIRLRLDAESGPLDTGDYRIVLEAAPAEEGRTAIHMSYAYSYGLVARIAMEAYLATFGRHKVGFTQNGHASNGQPRYVGGMRGVVERSTMLYYLAVEAYLGSMSAAPGARFDKSMRSWHAAVERYPQLHEMQREDYLAMKRLEFASTIGPAAIGGRAAP